MIPTITPETVTIDDHIRTHFEAADGLNRKDPLAGACWTAKNDILSKLKDIRNSAAWLARDLERLVESIDREGVEASVNSSGVTGSLADQINLGGAALEGLKARLQILEQLRKSL